MALPKFFGSARIPMTIKEIKMLMDLAGLQTNFIAAATGYLSGDVSACLKGQRAYLPLRTKIEDVFADEIGKRLIESTFSPKERELLLTLLDISVSSLAPNAGQSEQRINAWLAGSPATPAQLKRIKDWVCLVLKAKLFDSTFDAKLSRPPRSKRPAVAKRSAVG